MARTDKPVTDSSRQGRRGDLKSQTQLRQPAASRDGTPGSQQNRRAVKSNQGVGKQQDIQQNAPAATPQLIQQEHVPMNGFNAADVIAMMKSGVDAKVAVYKPEGKDATTKGSPWGTKAGAMSNGKDFWLEFRKKTAAIKANDGERKGG